MDSIKYVVVKFLKQTVVIQKQNIGLIDVNEDNDKTKITMSLNTGQKMEMVFKEPLDAYATLDKIMSSDSVSKINPIYMTTII